MVGLPSGTGILEIRKLTLVIRVCITKYNLKLQQETFMSKKMEKQREPKKTKAAQSQPPQNAYR